MHYIKNKIAILLIALQIILNSCNCVETQLTKEEKEWFSVYKKGQAIIFKSNYGNLDTIVVTEKSEFHGNKDCNWLEVGTIQNHMMHMVFKSKDCRNKSDCEGRIEISKDKMDEKSFPFFRIFGLEYAPASQKNTLKQRSIKLTTTNKIFSASYYFEDKVNANSYGSNYLKSFYWDKNAGLIRYEKNDGEIFELLKKNKLNHAN